MLHERLGLGVAWHQLLSRPQSRLCNVQAFRLSWLAACSDESACLHVVVVVVVVVDFLVDQVVARRTRRILLLSVHSRAEGRSSGEAARNQGSEGNSY